VFFCWSAAQCCGCFGGFGVDVDGGGFVVFSSGICS
jgi:hypothetical protein